VSDVILKGRLIGFEEYESYAMQDPIGEGSPFRLLICAEAPITFVVMNPYYVEEDYSFDIDDAVLNRLFPKGDAVEDIAVLCVVRADENALFVNLRSPIIINTKTGAFVQTILQNEAYGVSVPFTVKKAG
jgi:flagellar assembly factor FliW